MAIKVNTTRNPALDDGVWTEFQGSRLCIAHTSNANFQRTLNRLQAPHRKAIEKGNMDPEESKIIVCKALAQSILKNWEGVQDENGGELEFTVSMAETALRNDEELREFVQTFSTDLSGFRKEEIAEKGKS